MQLVLCVHREPRVTELPVLAAVLVSFEKWNWRECWGWSCQTGWYVRATEVRVHGKLFEQTAVLYFCCRAKMSLSCVQGKQEREKNS